jgi:CRISPR-associated endonuclease/helicase Cas3
MNTTLTDLIGNEPFPWQNRLYRLFADGNVPRALDLPTGLGKTSVMAIWLAARAEGAPLPRRLVYIVDRRVVVDQATRVAEELQQASRQLSKPQRDALGLVNDVDLPISTLRGQFVDNEAWLATPHATSIVVGTVDMIGSRLLFDGYGVTRKMKPYHAGFLGVDTLFVLDEAHLVPPFEQLLKQLTQNEDKTLSPRQTGVVPLTRLMSLSATGREGGDFQLDADDEAHPEVRKRITAVKHATLIELQDEELSERIAREVWSRAKNTTDKFLVFCNSRDDALAVDESLRKMSKADGVSIAREVIVGERRVAERQQLAKRLEELGFIAGAQSTEAVPRIVCATSAGEVGIDLDADHMVCDLVAWERMVQRLGRVNRRGNTKSTIIVVRTPKPEPSKAEAAALAKKDELGKKDEKTKVRANYEARVADHAALPVPFSFLPTDGDCHDVSLLALRNLKTAAAHDSAKREALERATTKAPFYPPLTRPLVDSWAMTSLKEHTGRPDIQPWLRGWIDNDEPKMKIVWRVWLPTAQQADEFFDVARPAMVESLEVEVSRFLEWLKKRVKARERIRRSESSANKTRETLFVLDRNEKIREVPFDRALTEENFSDDLAGSTVVVPDYVGGINKHGVLDEDVDDAATSYDQESCDGMNVRVHREKMERGESTKSTGEWKLLGEFVEDEREESFALIVEGRGFSSNEDARSATCKDPQTLAQHQEWTEAEATKIVDQLKLSASLSEAIRVAAVFHDKGKAALRWQSAFKAPKVGGPYAKVNRGINQALLDGYRHEFGSLPLLEDEPRFQKLDAEMKELCRHLVAAHHGFARPMISTRGCDDAPPSVLARRAQEIAERFLQLQNTWGPWGLAWLESLVRAADQLASARQSRGEK